MQGAAALRVACVDLGLLLQQQLHAGGIVFLGPGCGQHRRLAAGGFGLGAAFEQELRQAPVAGGAGDAQRREPVDIERIDFGGGIAQQRGHARIGAARGVMQRGVAVMVDGARIGAVGQQRHHRIGTPVPAVAGGGEQRRHAGMGDVEVDAMGDQRTQQAQVRQHGGEHRQAALVALLVRRRRMQVGAGIDQLQRLLDAARAGGGVELGFQRHAAGRQIRWRCRLRPRSRPRPPATHRPVQRVAAANAAAGEASASDTASVQRATAAEQPRPRQQHDRAEHRGHHHGHAQAAPGAGIELTQLTPVPRQRAAFGFQSVPQRPQPPQAQQHQAGHEAQAESGHQRSALDQRRQRPGDHGQHQHEGAAPQQGQPTAFNPAANAARRPGVRGTGPRPMRRPVAPVPPRSWRKSRRRRRCPRPSAGSAGPHRASIAHSGQRAGCAAGVATMASGIGAPVLRHRVFDRRRKLQVEAARDQVLAHHGRILAGELASPASAPLPARTAGCPAACAAVRAGARNRRGRPGTRRCRLCGGFCRRRLACRLWGRLGLAA